MTRSTYSHGNRLQIGLTGHTNFLYLYLYVCVCFYPSPFYIHRYFYKLHLYLSRWPARSRNQCENPHDNRCQIGAGSCLELRRGTQNRLEIDPGTLSGRPVAPKGVRKASQERLGSLSELPSAPRDCLESPRKWHGMPGRVPESARQRFGAVKIDAKSRPGTQKASFPARLFCEALSSRISVDFLRFSGFS